jgi:hypothetical protein
MLVHLLNQPAFLSSCILFVLAKAELMSFNKEKTMIKLRQELL